MNDASVFEQDDAAGKSGDRDAPKEVPGNRGMFSPVIGRFVAEVDSLASTLPLAMKSITLARRAARERFNDFISAHAKTGESDGGIIIDVSQGLALERFIRDVRRTSAASVLVPRSFLVALISQYDHFLGLLIEVLLLSKPEILNASDKTLTFSELLDFGSLDAARGHVIEKEVETVLRKSHEEQFDWLGSKFGVKLREGLDVWPEFIEVTERRNLFVHTGGQVSAQYVKVCCEHGVKLGKIVRNETLNVPSKYFNRAYEVVFEIGIKLAHVFWRKLKPEERKAADANLLNISYELLVEEKYGLAKTILDFATEVLKTYASESYRLQFVVNRILAYKLSGQADLAMALLKKEDFSALSEDFKMAEAVLRDDYQTALALVRAMGAEGRVKLGDYREWPLFKDLRKQPEFESAILEVFNQPLNQISIASALARAKDEATPLPTEAAEESVGAILTPTEPSPQASAESDLPADFHSSPQ